MQQSNGYIIGFATALTIILGGVLSFAAVVLKPIQKKEASLDKQKQILSAVINTSTTEKSEIAGLYEKRIQSVVVDYNGNEVPSGQYNAESPEALDVKKEYKKTKRNPQEVLLPVYKFLGEDGESIDAYILPVYGSGLWDDIWGYVALEPDLNTVRGVSFDHKAETPGLGARITDAEVQKRYKGKKLFDDGELVSVNMLKGEGNKDLNEHQVDGMSGATITGNGVNDMLKSYAGYYKSFFETVKSSGQASL